MSEMQIFNMAAIFFDFLASLKRKNEKLGNYIASLKHTLNHTLTLPQSSH